MSDLGLKAADICRIIKECKGVGVSELKFGDLHIQFRPQSHVESTQSQGFLDSTEEVEITDEPATTENSTNEIGMFDEQASEDALYSQLLIDDPVAFEKMQMLEGLESGRSD